MAAAGGGAPMYSGYGQPPKIRFEVIGEAWQLFTQQMSTWVMAILVMFVALIIPGIIMVVGMLGSGLLGSMAGEHGGAAVFGLGMMMVFLVGILLMVAISVVMMGGLFRMAIKQIRGEAIQLSDLWSVTDVFGKLIVAGILIGLSICVAMIACYFPAFIVAGLLMLTIPLIVDQNMSPIDAMTRSWNALKQEWLMATVLYFVLSFIATLGAYVIIGALFTYPILFLGVGLVYRDFILGGGGPPTGTPYPVGVTPGGYPPDLYAAQQPPPPTEPR